MSGIVVGVLVAVRVAEFFHQFCGGVPEVERNRSCLSLSGKFKCLVDCKIG